MCQTTTQLNDNVHHITTSIKMTVNVSQALNDRQNTQTLAHYYNTNQSRTKAYDDYNNATEFT